MRQKSKGGSVRGVVKLVGVFLAALLFFNGGISGFLFKVSEIEAASEIENWWPVWNARVKGVQPFKFVVPGWDISEYDAFWQVGDGALNGMRDSYESYPHKKAEVDLSGWTWREEGSYTITFIAKEKNGNEIARKSFPIQIDRSVDISISDDENKDESRESPQDGSKDTDKKETTGNTEVEISWPIDQAHIGGVGAFKAKLDQGDANEYEMYWRVGGDRKNRMRTVGNRKEAIVDLSGWTWRGDRSYEVTFIAEDEDRNEIARKSVSVYVNSKGSEIDPTIKTEDGEEVVVETESTVSRGGILGKKLYVNPDSNAKRQADTWRHSRPEDAQMMDIIAGQPQAVWLGGWNSNIESDVRSQVSVAQSAGAVAVFVAYNIPHRDCGLYSAGGVSGSVEYGDWIKGLARGLSGSGSVVILEPDALAGADCLSDDLKAERKQMISEAIVTLKNAGATVYVESSTPPWKSTEEMARRLREVGVEKADGFALNTSSFTATEKSIQYGYEISNYLGGMHFVVDTSRSGRGQNEALEWCNPWGRGLGERPTTNTGRDRVDAFLWVKSPGESDGNCNGGPNAGHWFPEYALDLARNRSF